MRRPRYYYWVYCHYGLRRQALDGRIAGYAIRQYYNIYILRFTATDAVLLRSDQAQAWIGQRFRFTTPPPPPPRSPPHHRHRHRPSGLGPGHRGHHQHRPPGTGFTVRDTGLGHLASGHWPLAGFHHSYRSTHTATITTGQYGPGTTVRVATTSGLAGPPRPGHGIRPPVHHHTTTSPGVCRAVHFQPSITLHSSFTYWHHFQGSGQAFQFATASGSPAHARWVRATPAWAPGVATSRRPPRYRVHTPGHRFRPDNRPLGRPGNRPII